MATTRTAKTQEAALRECSDKLAAMIAYRHLYGGREIVQMSNIARRLQIALTPEDPSALEAEARAFIAVNASAIDKNRVTTQQREEEAKALAAKRQAVRDKHRAEVAERIEKAEERRMQHLASIRGVEEVLG